MVCDNFKIVTEVQEWIIILYEIIYLNTQQIPRNSVYQCNQKLDNLSKQLPCFKMLNIVGCVDPCLKFYYPYSSI